MKNILLITGIYPTGESTYHGTHVCHYFAIEWGKMGYNVQVVHLNPILPKVYFLIGKIFKTLAAKKMWSVHFLHSSNVPQKYQIDGINIMYEPIMRPIPHHRIPIFLYQKACRQISSYLKDIDFNPDIITGHWNVEIIAMLKQQYPLSKTATIFHESMPMYIKKYLDNIDVLGFRSNALKLEFEQKFGSHKNEFWCFSGVPEEYLTAPQKIKSTNVNKFIYAGKLIQGKFISHTIDALNSSLKDDDYIFNIVGDGPEMHNLRKQVDNLNLNNKVIFHGLKNRNDVLKLLNDSQCFIMVSRPEAFGLVYLEAMANGCISIAAKGEGGDGIVVDDKNGFLCQAGNIQELIEVLNNVKSLSPSKFNRMSNAAYNTAVSMTDRKAAEHYINSILTLNK